MSCLVLLRAQSTAEAKPGETKAIQNTVLPLSLRYDEPKTYPTGTKQSVIIGDFKCGGDGTVFLPMMEDPTALNGEINGGPRTDRLHRILVTALTPSGDVVRFAHAEIPGLRTFVPDVRYFVSSSRVYTLESAQMYDPADPAKSLGRVHLILIYDYQGAYKGVVRLEPGSNPINIAAFPSGDILVVSLDKLNQTTRLLLFDQAGRPLKELRLFDEDYALKLKLRDKAETPGSAGGPIWTSLALAHWVPFGEDLLMSPTTESTPPLIEINENGVVRSTNVSLPENAALTGISESSDKIYHVVGSEKSQVEPSASDPPGQKFSYTPTEVDDINPGDGTVLRRVKFTRGLWPVCVRDESYTFLSPRDEDGRLQIIRGTVIR
jgi:hypothetical protein